MLHILERFAIHFASSCFLTLAFFFALRYWVRHSMKAWRWVSCKKEHLLVLSALCVFSVLPLREPWDVFAQNNTVLKSYFDILSWFLGPAVSVWGLSRFDRLED